MTQEEKIKEIKEGVIAKLIKNNIPITSIMTFFREGKLLRDGKTYKDVFLTSIREPLFGKVIFIISDPETLEMLYVQTEVKRFMEVDDFFKPRKNHKN